MLADTRARTHVRCQFVAIVLAYSRQRMSPDLSDLPSPDRRMTDCRLTGLCYLNRHYSCCAILLAPCRYSHMLALMFAIRLAAIVLAYFQQPLATICAVSVLQFAVCACARARLHACVRLCTRACVFLGVRACLLAYMRALCTSARIRTNALTDAGSAILFRNRYRTACDVCESGSTSHRPLNHRCTDCCTDHLSDLIVH